MVFPRQFYVTQSVSRDWKMSNSSFLVSNKQTGGIDTKQIYRHLLNAKNPVLSFTQALLP